MTTSIVNAASVVLRERCGSTNTASQHGATAKNTSKSMHAKVALLAATATAFAPPPSQPPPPRLHAASIALEEEPAKPVRGVRRAALWMNVRSALCYANNIFPKNAYGRGVSFRAKREGFWVSPANPWAAKPIIRACRTIKRGGAPLAQQLT